MFSRLMPTATASSDAELVAASLAGDRSAFGVIVSRYQTLVCSIAYNATGNLRLSEDLAQETFLAAWRDLAQLRDGTKLRSWLCGIARHRACRGVDRGRHEPTHDAEPLDAAGELPASEPLPSQEAVSREEQAILWRAIERIPDGYREPLILFYREHQSIERVATQLGLSEDAVRQRLSRGRKLLHDEVAAFVGNALARTSPGAMFTANVLGAIPALVAPSVTAASAGVAAKGSAAVKLAGAVPLIGAIAGPAIGLLSGWLGFRISLENAESGRERQYLRRMAWLMLAAMVAAAVAAGGFVLVTVRTQLSERTMLLAISATLELLSVLAIALVVVRATRDLPRIRREEADRVPNRTKPWFTQRTEYRSRLTFLGLPLLHVRLEYRVDGKMQPAVGWIAVGNVAYGVLAGFGGIATGAISIGGVAVGLFAIGGTTVGVLAVGGLALGLGAVGGVALGYVATGGVALGWQAAMGGVSLSHYVALGGSATAPHANEAVAQHFRDTSMLFQTVIFAARRIGFLIWAPLALVAWQLLALRRAKGSGTSGR